MERAAPSEGGPPRRPAGPFQVLSDQEHGPGERRQITGEDRFQRQQWRHRIDERDTGQEAGAVAVVGGVWIAMPKGMMRPRQDNRLAMLGHHGQGQHQDQCKPDAGSEVIESAKSHATRLAVAIRATSHVCVKGGRSP